MSTQSPNRVFNNAESTNIYVNSITTHRPTNHEARLAYYVTSFTKDARTADQTARLSIYVNSITTHRPTHHADRLAYYVTSLTKDARTTDQTAILTTFVNT